MQEVQRALGHAGSALPCCTGLERRRWKKLNAGVACVALGLCLLLLQVCGKGGDIGNTVCAQTRFAVITL